MANRLASLRNSSEFAEEQLVARAQSLLHECMVSRGLSQTDLANKMGVSKGRVSQIFSDRQNFTLRLIANAFYALGQEVTIELANCASSRVSKQKALGDNTNHYRVPNELLKLLFPEGQSDTVFFEKLAKNLTDEPRATNWARHSDLKRTFDKIRTDDEEIRGFEQKAMSDWAGSNVVSLERKREKYASAR